MKRLVLSLLAALGLIGAGCSRKREITTLQRQQAAALITEAQFALTIRDLPRAEGLFRQAAETCPDTGAYWINLGSVCRKLGQTAEVKQAYGRAVDAFASAFAANGRDVGPLLDEMYACALLGRMDDARALLKNARAKFATDPRMRGVDDQTLDRMLGDPAFQAQAI
ncbi:MAG: hypothetical protein ACHQ4G_04455 [Opitutales bacterium]